jgi:hypothetical protein
MLSQLIQFVTAHSDRLSSPQRRRRRTYRGRFEQLETRALLTASIGVAPAVVSLSGNPPDQVAGPVGPPAYVAYPVLPPPSYVPGRPQKIVMSDPQQLEQPELAPPMGISLSGSTVPGEVYVDAWKFYRRDGSAPVIKEFKGSVPFDALSQTLSTIETTFDPGREYNWHWQMVGGNSVATPAHPGNDPAPPGPKPPVYTTDGDDEVTQKGLPNNSNGAGVGPTGPSYGNFPSDLTRANSESAEPEGSAASHSQRAYDSVFQSYSTQTSLLALDSSNGMVADSLAERRLGSDDGQGGFVKLDDARLLDGSTSQSAPDATRDAIDIVLANLDALGSSAIAHDTAEGDGSGLTGDSEMLVGDGQQGGMIVLESLAGPSSDTALAAGQAATPTNWNVPETGLSMEASVGIYQAFDVATGDLTSSAPTAVAIPAVMHTSDAKAHVSADKLAKPTTDQASAWVEMLTAAAVIGTAKKKRKSQAG